MGTKLLPTILTRNEINNLLFALGDIHWVNDADVDQRRQRTSRY